jgi:hypothetical protein
MLIKLGIVLFTFICLVAPILVVNYLDIPLGWGFITSCFMAVLLFNLEKLGSSSDDESDVLDD